MFHITFIFAPFFDSIDVTFRIDVQMSPLRVFVDKIEPLNRFKLPTKTRPIARQHVADVCACSFLTPLIHPTSLQKRNLHWLAHLVIFWLICARCEQDVWWLELG
jgi:hypothetical protein